MVETDFKSAYGTRNYEQDRIRLQWGAGGHYYLYRRADVDAGSWFLRYHIKGEGRHFRKSLKTNDLEVAKIKAHEAMIDLSARIKNGQKVISPAIKDVEALFWKAQDELMKAGQLAPRTLVMQRYRVRLGWDFIASKLPLGLDTRIASVDGAIFNDYLQWRTSKAAMKGKTIRRDVVRDELLVIRKVFTFAHKKRLCSESAIPTWSFPVEPDGPARRRFTGEDYGLFLRTLDNWAVAARSDRDAYHRMMLHHFVLVVASTGLRSGELFGMRNRDLRINRDAQECVLSVRREYSKVRKARDVTLGASPSVGGQLVNPLISWLDHCQRHREPTDHVFAPYDSGGKDARDVYYHAYKAFRRELKKVGLEWFDTYHCRHVWITEQLREQHSIHDVAKAAGTSTEQIERTYSHISTEQTTRAFGLARLRQMASYKAPLRPRQPAGAFREVSFADASNGGGAKAEGAADADVAQAHAA